MNITRTFQIESWQITVEGYTDDEAHFTSFEVISPGGIEMSAGEAGLDFNEFEEMDGTVHNLPNYILSHLEDFREQMLEELSVTDEA